MAGDNGRVTAAFDKDGEIVTIPPARLAGIETVNAMTIHKSQGSQFDAVTVLLPDPTSRLLTRELLYTARAQRQLNSDRHQTSDPHRRDLTDRARLGGG